MSLAMINPALSFPRPFISFPRPFMSFLSCGGNLVMNCNAPQN
ncbi:MAG: hypothetical protein SFT68_02055 [Rickettsiaceae bacterium]|nr:hypothetical protein [Rickettsiaceae bacterium]